MYIYIYIYVGYSREDGIPGADGNGPARGRASSAHHKQRNTALTPAHVQTIHFTRH